jgi:hypothetical protein
LGQHSTASIAEITTGVIGLSELFEKRKSGADFSEEAIIPESQANDSLMTIERAVRFNAALFASRGSIGKS